MAGEWLCGRLAGAVFRHHAVLIFELLFTLVLLVRAEVVVEHRTPRDQQTAIATLPKKPVAVLDSIEMIRVADAATTTAVSPDQRLVAHFSPDGKQFVVVLRKFSRSLPHSRCSSLAPAKNHRDVFFGVQRAWHTGCQMAR